MAVAIGRAFALCTFVSALAPTTWAETRAPEPPEGAPQMSVAAKGVPSSVQQAPPYLPAGDQRQLAGRFIDERLALWRQRLKLDGWRISVVMTHRRDLKPKTLGGIRWDKPRKNAVIWVLDPSEYQLPFYEVLDDIELTLVHELVHLELSSLPRSEASRSSEEHAVNGIAEALLGLDRKETIVSSEH